MNKTKQTPMLMYKIKCPMCCWPKYVNGDIMKGKIEWPMGILHAFPVLCGRENWKTNMTKRHWLIEMAWMLLAKMLGKCEWNLLFVQVWTQVSLVQMLRLGMWKGQYDEEALIGCKNHFCKFKLISNEKNHFKFNNFIGLKIMKWPSCT